MRRHPFAATATLFASVVLSIPPQHSVKAQTTPTLERIGQAWKDRQVRIQSLNVSWDEQQVVNEALRRKRMLDEMQVVDKAIRESERRNGSQPRAAADLADQLPPAKQVTHLVHSSLIVVGAGVRYSTERPQWNAREKKYVLETVTSGFQDGESRKLRINEASELPWPRGLVKDGVGMDLRLLSLYPLRFAVRPTDPHIRPFDIGTMTITGRSTVIQKKKCLELERVSGAEILRIWVDPERDFSVVRLTNYSGERVKAKVDVRYQRYPDGVYIPSNWETITFGADGAMGQSVSASVTECKLNEGIDASVVRVEFPDGTLVTEQRSDQQLGQYIVRPGGSKRVVRPEEMGRVPYATLVSTEPNLAPRTELGQLGHPGRSAFGGHHSFSGSTRPATFRPARRFHRY